MCGLFSISFSISASRISSSFSTFIPSALLFSLLYIVSCYMLIWFLLDMQVQFLRLYANQLGVLIAYFEVVALHEVDVVGQHILHHVVRHTHGVGYTGTGVHSREQILLLLHRGGRIEVHRYVRLGSFRVVFWFSCLVLVG